MGRPVVALTDPDALHAHTTQARKFLTSIMIKHHPEEVIAHTSASSSSSSASFDDEATAGSGGDGGAKRGSLDSMEARCVRLCLLYIAHQPTNHGPDGPTTLILGN